MLDVIEELKKSSEINKAISNKMIDNLKELDNIYDMITPKEEKENTIIYSNIKKGVKQFSIQLIIVVIILLVIIGAYQLVNLIF